MKDRKSIFFTSDWHIGHANVIIYSKRPFKDVSHMARVLINNFNAAVSPDSVTYFLGDMGMGNGEDLQKVLSELNGTKVLLLGNHDKNSTSMYAKGFDVVLNTASLYIAQEKVTMSHCPLAGVFREDVTGMKGAMPLSFWHGDHKNQAFTVANEDQYHLHGHIHSPNGGKSTRILEKQFDVGVDANKYRPVSISQIESWISLYKQGKPYDK